MVQPEMLDPSRFPFLRSRTRIKALKATDELLRRPGLVAEPFRLLKNCTFSLYICVCVWLLLFQPQALPVQALHGQMGHSLCGSKLSLTQASPRKMGSMV